MVGPTKTYYAGRFRFDLPATFVRSSQRSDVRDVAVDEVALPPGMPLDEARRVFWTKHVDELRAEYRAHKLPPILEEGELRPGVPRILSRGYDEDDRVLEVLLTEQRRGAMVKVEWRPHVYETERPAQLAERQRSFAQVIEAYRFLAPGYTARDPGWFYLSEGAITLPYGVSDRKHKERLGVAFTDDSKDFTVNLDAVFPNDEDDAAKLSFLARLAKTAVQMIGIGGRTIRSGKRTVAGFHGEETLIHVKDENHLLFGWIYEPTPNDKGYQPKIVIQMELEDDDIDAKLALWDRILDGIQRLAPN